MRLGNPQLKDRSSVLILVVFVAVLVILMSLISSLADQQPEDISVSAGSYKIDLVLISPQSLTGLNTGSTITVGVDALLPGTDTAGNPTIAELVINYDPAILTGVSITGGIGSLSLNNRVDNVNGVMTIDIAHEGEGAFVGTYRLALLSFTLAAKTNTSVNLSNVTTLGYPNLLDFTGSKNSLAINVSAPQCGNSILESGEVCDGGTTSCQIVQEICTSTPQGCIFPTYSGIRSCKADCTGYNDVCTTSQRCGDRVKNGNEQCDDGNTNESDGCSSACVISSVGNPGSTTGNTNSTGGNNENTTTNNNSVTGTEEAENSNDSNIEDTAEEDEETAVALDTDDTVTEDDLGSIPAPDNQTTTGNNNSQIPTTINTVDDTVDSQTSSESAPSSLPTLMLITCMLALALGLAAYMVLHRDTSKPLS